MKIVPPYVRESLENLLKKNGYLIMRINKRDEFDANIDYWMNLDHLRIHIVKLPLTDQVLTYRGRSIKDIEPDPYLLSLSSASGAKNRKLFEDKFVRKITKYVKPGRTAADAMSLPMRSDLKSLPEWCSVLPWEKWSVNEKMNIYKKQFITARRNNLTNRINQNDENIFYSKIAWISHAKQFYNLYHSISKNGFRDTSHPILNVIINEGTFKFMLSGSGNHRLMCASILGIRSIYVKIGSIININDIAYWPNVANGYYSLEEANKIFLDYFNMNGYGSYV